MYIIPFFYIGTDNEYLTFLISGIITTHILSFMIFVFCLFSKKDIAYFMIDRHESGIIFTTNEKVIVILCSLVFYTIVEDILRYLMYKNMANVQINF
jgi:hypothetical protein